MALLQFACPHCQGVFQVDDAMSGQTVACPHCQGHVQVAGNAAVPPESSSPNDPPQAPPEPQRQPSRFPEPPSFPGQSVPSRPSPPSEPETTPNRPPRPTASPEAPVSPPSDKPSSGERAGKGKFVIECGKCSGTFRSNPAMVGQQVLCPYCSARLKVPEGGGRAEPADVTPADAPAIPTPAQPASDKGRAIIVDKPQTLVDAPVNADTADDAKRHAESNVFKPAEGEEIVDPELAVKDEGKRLVKVGDQYVEIRRLTPEEKAARRFRRNIVMVVLGAIVLGVAIFFLIRQ